MAAELKRQEKRVDQDGAAKPQRTAEASAVFRGWNE